MKLFNQRNEEIEVDPAQKETMLKTGHFFEERSAPQETDSEKSAPEKTADELTQEAKEKLIHEINGYTRKELDAYIAKNNLEVPAEFTNMPDQKDWIIINLDK